MTSPHSSFETRPLAASKGWHFAYWGTTGLLSVALLGSGFAKLSAQPALVESMQHLGFPTYLLSILGFWSVAAALTLLVPGAARLKEWAYAGIVFQMTGAAASHLLAGDPAGQAVAPLVLSALAVGSYTLRPAARRMHLPEPGRVDTSASVASSSDSPGTLRAA